MINEMDQCTDTESSIPKDSLRTVSKFNRYPFDPASLPFDPFSMTYMEIKQGTKVYNLLLEHIAISSIEFSDFVGKASSFSEPKILSADDDDDDDDDDESHDDCCDRSTLTSGMGLFAFKDDKGTDILALHQQIGDPIGTNCGVSIYSNIVLFTSKVNSVNVLTNVLKHLITASEKTSHFYFNCYKWNAKHEYWRRSGKAKARNMDSVVLPKATKAKILDDISKFLRPETRKFYDDHGIPYRRSFLFYGVPGAGKTSLIQAIAGHFKRNVSFLQLTDEDMNDSNLLSSIQNLTKNTIVVMEDIDACFAKDRSNKISHSKITFSGLLNALDGVGSSTGQIFILTTNIRDQLDPALIRCGRVDLQIEFKHAVDEQVVQMWKAFYPSSPDLSEEFTRRLRQKLQEKQINTASLQHFFVLNMHNSAEEALDSLERVIDDMEFTEKVMASAAEGANSEDSKEVSWPNWLGK